VTNRQKKFLLLSPFMVGGVVLLAILGGWIVQQLWNWLLPPLFAWPQITVWQGLALLALCRILFGGLGGHGSQGGRGRKGERFKDITPEERDRLRQALRDGVGLGPAASEGPGH
jgi:hypothetical protein